MKIKVLFLIIAGLTIASRAAYGFPEKDPIEEGGTAPADTEASIDATDGNRLLGKLPTRMIQVMETNKSEKDIRQRYTIYYDCRCGNRAVEIDSETDQMFIYSICADFDRSSADDYERYKVINVGSEGSWIRMEAKNTRDGSTDVFTFSPRDSGLIESSLDYEAMYWDKELGSATLIDANNPGQFRKESADCGDYDG